jgi:hypothetical protein
MNRKTTLMAVILFSSLLLAACQTTGPVADVPEEGAARASFPESLYDNLASEDGTVFRVDNEASEVLFFMWRGGPMAHKGHNHVMRATDMTGAVFLPEDMLSGEPRIDIVFPVKEIDVDPLPLREKIGGAFASTGITEEGARKTREHMLAESSMHAERFPTIGLSAKKVHGEPPKLAIDMAMTIHGIQRRQLIPATVRVDGDTLTATGSFAIRQTRFGIEPSSAMGGALYVQDPIMIEFKVVARAR